MHLFSVSDVCEIYRTTSVYIKHSDVVLPFLLVLLTDLTRKWMPRFFMELQIEETYIIKRAWNVGYKSYCRLRIVWLSLSAAVAVMQYIVVLSLRKNKIRVWSANFAFSLLSTVCRRWDSFQHIFEHMPCNNSHWSSSRHKGYKFWLLFKMIENGCRIVTFTLNNRMHEVWKKFVQYKVLLVDQMASEGD